MAMLPSELKKQTNKKTQQLVSFIFDLCSFLEVGYVSWKKLNIFALLLTSKEKMGWNKIGILYSQMPALSQAT